MQFGIGHPPPLHQLQSTCVGEGSRVPNLQTEFNYLDSFESYGIFSDFVVPVVPMLSPSSACHPRHPHVVPIAPRRFPCGPHGCGLRGLLCCLCGLHPMWSPCHPHCPHIVPRAPRWSPWLWSPWSPLLSPWSPPYVVPMVPTSSPSSPRHLEGPHIIPNPPDTHSTYPHPAGGWGSQIS